MMRLRVWIARQLLRGSGFVVRQAEPLTAKAVARAALAELDKALAAGPVRVRGQ